MTESNGCLKELERRIRKKLITNETEDIKYCKTQIKNDFRISRDT